MALTPAERASIILDLLKDGVVGTESNYTPAKVDRFNPAAALSIYQDFWVVRRPGNPTPDEAADFFLTRLKEFAVANAETAAGPPAGRVAEQAAKASARARVNADLGV